MLTVAEALNADYGVLRDFKEYLEGALDADVKVSSVRMTWVAFTCDGRSLNFTVHRSGVLHHVNWHKELIRILNQEEEDQ